MPPGRAAGTGIDEVIYVFLASEEGLSPRQREPSSLHTTWPPVPLCPLPAPGRQAFCPRRPQVPAAGRRHVGPRVELGRGSGGLEEGLRRASLLSWKPCPANQNVTTLAPGLPQPPTPSPASRTLTCHLPSSEPSHLSHWTPESSGAGGGSGHGRFWPGVCLLDGWGY
ncbi:hypothetical protein GHT09_009949 [Marmota monax]|uniref:Uncharacterized protein n=1 Tax=Marmota monax TaxID=9995 RepID=A0A834QKM0_MARMO|nr:hypothetical protein GHT09_009949 [Marmota monax]